MRKVSIIKNEIERRKNTIKIYTTLATIFWLIRQFLIPNPFEVLGEGITMTSKGISILLTPELLNLLADPIIFGITFGIVGFYYVSGSAPALGSFLYMFFYCVHIAGIYLLLSIYPTMWLIVLILVIYVALHITALIIKFKRSF